MWKSVHASKKKEDSTDEHLCYQPQTLVHIEQQLQTCIYLQQKLLAALNLDPNLKQPAAPPAGVYMFVVSLNVLSLRNHGAARQPFGISC